MVLPGPSPRSTILLEVILIRFVISYSPAGRYTMPPPADAASLIAALMAAVSLTLLLFPFFLSFPLPPPPPSCFCTVKILAVVLLGIFWSLPWYPAYDQSGKRSLSSKLVSVAPGKVGKKIIQHHVTMKPSESIITNSEQIIAPYLEQDIYWNKR